MIQAALAGKAALGPRAGKRARRIQVVGGQEMATGREGLERLCRYILSPSLAKSRLERLTDGTLVVGLKRAWVRRAPRAEMRGR